MRLFHFCATQFLDGIKREGLTRGMTPILKGDNIAFLAAQQWLTRNPSFEQSWNGRVNVKYDRAAFRLTIKIPNSHQGQLIPFIPTYRAALNGNMLPDFDADEDCKNWFVFIGQVKPGWIREVVERPAVAMPASR